MFISSHLSTNVPLKTETEIQEAIELLKATLHNAVLVATPVNHNVRIDHMEQVFTPNATNSRQLLSQLPLAIPNTNKI
ncbi:hypothetical protein BC826DRAFT_1114190 [Russula brevipes]|nr:hypothetical protein BC826DRAFT_1114190 [Russula brevipes]